jgi:fermentation-respiration switch protein FrsA (DUF1100 family)
MSNGSRSAGAGLANLLIVFLVILGVAVAAGALLIHSATQPPRNTDRQDPADLLLPAEDVRLHTSDGIAIAAWFVRAKPGRPPIILCHDLGGSRSDLLNSAVSLNKAGYPLLLLDFRRHGDSGAARTTLGINERLDVMAGVAFLAKRPDVNARRIGGWGVGMGAYALALAATETPALGTLALDSIYSDVPSEVDRLVRQKLPPALHGVVAALRPLYDPTLGVRLRGWTIKERVSGLSEKSVLLIAGSESPGRFDEERLLYDAIPERPEGGKNLLELRRAGLKGLYDEDRTHYDEAILRFFADTLAPGAGGATGPVEVIEK